MYSKSLFYLGLIFVVLTTTVVYILGLDCLNDISYYQQFDTISYLDAGNRLLNHQSFHPTRCIGYPLFLKLFQSLFSVTPLFFYSIYSVQLLMYAYVVLFQYRRLTKWLSESNAFVLVLFTLLNISYFVYAFFLLTEIPCLFLLVLAFEHAHRFLAHKKSYNLFFAAFFFGMGILFKPGLLFYFLFILFFLAVLTILKRITIKNVLLFYLGVVFSLGIQIGGMYKTYGRITLSYIGDITNYRYLHTAIIANQNKQDILPLMQQRDSLVLAIADNPSSVFSYDDFSDYVRSERDTLIKKHPSSFIKAYLNNLFSNFHTGNNVPKALPSSLARIYQAPNIVFNITRIFNMLFVGLLILAFLIGIYVSFLNRQYSFSVSILTKIAPFEILFCLYAFLISGVSFFQGDRFNVIWMPFLIPALIEFRQMLIRSIK